MNPMYQHNCNNCKFIGQTNYQFDGEIPKQYDLYYCDHHYEKNIVARYGNDPFDYLCGIKEAHRLIKDDHVKNVQHPLVVALDIATKLKFIG